MPIVMGKPADDSTECRMRSRQTARRCEREPYGAPTVGPAGPLWTSHKEARSGRVSLPFALPGLRRGGRRSVRTGARPGHVRQRPCARAAAADATVARYNRPQRTTARPPEAVARPSRRVRSHMPLPIRTIGVIAALITLSVAAVCLPAPAAYAAIPEYGWEWTPPPYTPGATWRHQRDVAAEGPGDSLYAVGNLDQASSDCTCRLEGARRAPRRDDERQGLGTLDARPRWLRRRCWAPRPSIASGR